MGFFDGFSATNQSQVIEASTCFAMMQEKIRAREHSAWRLFVEDFEWLCYNALICNHKRSIIWAAANDLLRRGKKSLEQYERWGEILVLLNKTGGSHSSFNSKRGASPKLNSENVGFRVIQHKDYPVTEGLRMAISSATTGSPESKPPTSGAASLCRDALVGKDVCSIEGLNEGKREEGKMTRGTTLFLTPVLDVASEETSNVIREMRDVESRRWALGGEPDNCPLAVQQMQDTVDVEGERDVDSGDYRGDLDGEATECSSSYDSAGSALEGDVCSDRIQSMFEAQSELRDGNGAGGLLEFEDVLLTSERATKPFDPEWKLYRRGIEWRCRWLELKKNLIKTKLSQYEKSLRSILSAKIWKWEGKVWEDASARTAPVKILREHPVIRRNHRRRAEDAQDLDLRRHPVFSRYEKRKVQRKSVEGKINSKQALHIGYKSDEPEGTFENVRVEPHPVEGDVLVRQNFMESILIEIESLQARVKEMKHLLGEDAAASGSMTVSKTQMSNLSSRAPPHAKRRDTSSAQAAHVYTLSTPSPKTIFRGGTPSSGGAGAGRTGSVSARRKTADYDINNMVMPQGAGTTQLERVRHVDIETPHWRLIEDAEQPGPETSSDEETTDEHYQNRHAAMERGEHQHLYVLPLKKSAGEIHTVGKGKLKMGKGKSDLKMTGKSGVAKLALPSGSVPFAPRSLDNVSRRQRTKNVRRPARAFSTFSDVLDVKPEVKTGASAEDAKVGVESGDVAPTSA